MTDVADNRTAGADSGGGCYIHIPFCRTLCSYCHFTRTARHDARLRRRLIEGIVGEFELYRSRCPLLATGGRPLRTAYIGGGTPSVLEPALMDRLLSGTIGRLAVADELEVTAEANPESTSPELLRAWRRAGITRISLGVQSLDDRILGLLGRHCDAATARRALRLAVAEFPRVAADWILGPGVRPRQLCDELTTAALAGVGHLSLYLLELHPGTPLADAVAAGRLQMPADAASEEHYLAAVSHLATLGFEQYEVANFSLPDQQSRHNRNYWRRVPYLGLGPGAHGFWGRRRYVNLCDPYAYLREVEAGRLPVAETDPLDRRARRLETLVLALRTTRGVPLRLLPPGFDLHHGRRADLWHLTAGRLQLTPRGFLHIDTIEQNIARRLPPAP